MAKNSKIEWTHHTFNPWIGCTKVSPACDNCYAENVGARLQVKWGAGQSRHRTSVSYWNDPRRWDRECAKEGRRDRVFCASLADVFDNEVPDQWRAELFALIRDTPNLDWLLLTKRIGNVNAMIERAAGWHFDHGDRNVCGWLTDWYMHSIPPANVWLGISVVDQDEVERDVPKLIRVRAAKRFLSMEPLLQSVTLAEILGMYWNSTMKCWEGLSSTPVNQDTWGRKKLDWVIVGGESGVRARPMNAMWAHYLQRECAAAGVAFFFKQGSVRNWPAYKDFSSFPPELQVREFPA